MGSLGWERCYWCRELEWNMYIPDGPDEPLCGRCLDRFIEGKRPPLQPDALARQAPVAELAFRCARFPPTVTQWIATFLESPFTP